jgi:hypothetical protein
MNLKLSILFLGAALFTGTLAPAFAAMDQSLLEMSEQMDGIDKQDFQSAINKANTCTRARNFSCAESELAKAAKSANSGQDKKTLLASQTGLNNERQALADEIRRAEEERLAQIRRDEEEEQAQRKNKEEREARAWREKRDAQDAEDRQATSNAWADLGRQIQQQGAEIGATMNTINRQKAAAINDSNRVLAAQAAERERARAEKAEREADRRRDAAAQQSARQAESRRAAEADRVATERRSATTQQQPTIRESTQPTNNYTNTASNASATPAAEYSSINKLPSSSGGSSAGQYSEKRYNYITDGQYRGVGRNETEGCEAAKKGGPNKSDIKRIISTGTCTCNSGYSNYYGKALECTIPFKAEISSPWNPDSESGGPSHGISK